MTICHWLTISVSGTVWRALSDSAWKSRCRPCVPMSPWKKCSSPSTGPSEGFQHLRGVPSAAVIFSFDERRLMTGPGFVPVPSSKHASSR